MAFDFPTGIPDGHVHPTPAGDFIWVAAKSAWERKPADGGAALIIADKAPAVQDKGLWWKSDSGQLYVGFDDGNSRQWVGVGGPPGKDAPPVVDASTTAKGLVQLADAAAAAAGTPGLVLDAQQALATFLSLAGGTMLGDLLLKGDPTAALMAATKGYVDERSFTKIVGSSTGNTLTFSANTFQFRVPGNTAFVQVVWMQAGVTNASGQLIVNWPFAFATPPLVVCVPYQTGFAANIGLGAHPVNSTATGTGIEASISSAGATSSWAGATINILAIGGSKVALP